MHDFWMKEMHFSERITIIGTSRFVSSHRQRVCYRMLVSLCRSDAQAADATPRWNTRSLLEIIPLDLNRISKPGTKLRTETLLIYFLLGFSIAQTIFSTPFRSEHTD
jgi:hypothetical protein